MHTLILALLCLVSYWPGVQNEVSWREFTSEVGKFSATMPDAPKYNLIVTNTTKGRFYTHSFSSTDENLNDYMVSWTDYQRDGMEQKAIQETFGKMRRALVAANSGKLLNESAGNLAGHPSTTVKFETSDGRLEKVMFSVVGNRIYQVTAHTWAKDSTSADRFLSSFKLLAE